ncbi:MAG: helix-turn-helix domain-containing protein [Candidatus Nanohaloarchaea archaeon]|nr:helix-turn-helix domain-containing protein [Candidatus Nanohaloarchaea archaeon]
MHGDDMTATVINMLRSAGWQHSYLENRCFDLFARSDEGSLILKVHENVDSADRASADELKQACRYLGAAPLIVGERTSRGELEPEVVYERYDIPTVTTETLRRYLQLQQRPAVYNKRGGYYVQVDGDRFERRRKEEGYSLNALAKEVGVSRKTVDTYRDGGAASVETAQRLEEVLGDVIRAVDFVEIEVEAQPAPDNRIAKRLVKIGFDASGFSQAPFDAAARDDEERFVGKRETDVEDALLEFLHQLQDMAESRTFLVTEDGTGYGELSSISERRMRRLEEKEEFKDAVRPE